MTTAIDRAVAAHRAGRIAQARSEVTTGLLADPSSLELHLFAGLLASQQRDIDAAIDHFRRALVIAPGQAMAQAGLARALTAAGDLAALAVIDAMPAAGPAGDEFLHLRALARQQSSDGPGAVADWQALVTRRPGDHQMGIEAARALADLGQFDLAETLYRGVLAAAPGDRVALLGLGGLLESLNRGGEMTSLVEQAGATSVDADVRSWVDALRARDAGDYGLALTLIDRARGALPPAAWHRFRGDMADRSGQPAAAIADFAAMNAIDAEANPEVGEGIDQFRAMIAANRALLDDLPPPAPDDGQVAPLFLLGFPRSGTTLLDTMLMGHPAVELFEERPFLDRADTIWQQAIDRGGAAAAAAEARAAYRAEMAAERQRPNARAVDKNPLATARIPLVHGMFPTARYLFALRHPCDVVLSCFMTRFRLNWGVASFLSLEQAARTYAEVMGLWWDARAMLDLDVMEVRYEALVDDGDGVLDAALRYAGLEPAGRTRDHRQVARERGMITSPSHAQVAEPLNRRAVGRWHRYRDQMAPVLPILKPWVERFGYAMN